MSLTRFQLIFLTAASMLLQAGTLRTADCVALQLCSTAALQQHGGGDQEPILIVSVPVSSARCPQTLHCTYTAPNMLITPDILHSLSHS